MWLSPLQNFICNFSHIYIGKHIIRIICSSITNSMPHIYIINQKVGSIEDFYKIASNRVVFKGGFRLGNLSDYIKAIDMRYYNLHRTEIDRMSCLEKIGDKNIYPN